MANLRLGDTIFSATLSSPRFRVFIAPACGTMGTRPRADLVIPNSCKILQSSAGTGELRIPIFIYTPDRRRLCLERPAMLRKELTRIKR